MSGRDSSSAAAGARSVLWVGAVPALGMWLLIGVWLLDRGTRDWFAASGAAGYVVVGFGVTLTLVLPACAALMAKWRHGPTAILALPAVLLPLIGAWGSRAVRYSALDAVTGASIDRAQKTRILVYGMNAALAATLFAALATAIVLGAVATSAAMRIRSQASRRGWGASTTLALGGGGVGVLLVVALAVLWPPARYWRWFQLPFVLGSWISAVLAGMALFEAPPDSESPGVAADLAVGAAGWAMALVFVAIAIWVSATHTTLGAVGGESMPLAEKFAISKEGLRESLDAFAAALVYVFPGLLAYLGVLIGRARVAVRGALAALAPAALVVVVLGLPAALLTVQMTRISDMFVYAFTPGTPHIPPPPPWFY